MMNRTQASRHRGIKASTAIQRTLAPSLRSAFTLTELLVAVAVLVLVIVATSKIFGTASQITGIGQANQDVLAEAAAIEEQLRNDIARLSHEGFFAIRNVAVRNDVNGAVLLNPNLPPGAIIRADQLVFFANGVQSTQAYRLGNNVFGNHKGQGTISRLYFGHGFQLQRGLPVNVGPGAFQASAHDPILQATTMVPWWNGNVSMTRTLFTDGTGTNGFSRSQPNIIDGTQPGARQWVLLRQPVALVDDDTGVNDDNDKTRYLTQTVTARSIFIDAPPGYGVAGATPREIFTGRVDAAATLANEIRRWITFSGATPRPWNDPAFGNPGGDQRDVIQSAVYWPRAERKPPGMHRVDQALTTSVISSACSSFIIDWTYEGSDGQRVDANNNIIGGVGEILDPNGNVVLDAANNPYSGMILPSTLEQPWFGLTDTARGVSNYGDAAFQTAAGYTPATTIAVANLESQSVSTPFIQDYWATFGYNQDRPRNAAGNIDPALGYTPWPTAIRITMVLHDPRGKLEAGREVQFIIDLPRK